MLVWSMVFPGGGRCRGGTAGEHGRGCGGNRCLGGAGGVVQNVLPLCV